MQITNQTIPDLKCQDPERVTPSSDSPDTVLSLTLQKLGSRIFRILDISLVRQRTNQKSRKVNSGKIEEGQFARTALFGFAFISQLPELPVDVGSHVCIGHPVSQKCATFSGSLRILSAIYRRGFLCDLKLCRRRCRIDSTHK